MSFSRNFSIFSISRFGSCMWNSHTKQIMLGLPWGWCSIWTGFGEKWVKESIQAHFKNISQVTPTARHCTVPDTVATQGWGLSLPSRGLPWRNGIKHKHKQLHDWLRRYMLPVYRQSARRFGGKKQQYLLGENRKAVRRRNNVGGEA